ncbi:AlpA family phage regulatory protein [Aeromonas piscicola]|uniref:AlpA family phage regulatory protein n=1 Tax=Aeromonas piscicola TaxID=600645 RepID=UPI0005B3D186|nr:AlpA family phage regulatory protein [Aeromonas piscicola]
MASTIKILRCNDLVKKLELSRSSLYDRMNPSSPRFDSSFPKAIRLGANSVGWFEHEIDQWLLGRRVH